MVKYPDSVNKYNHTPRKVFDRYTEKMDRKMGQIMKELIDLERVVRRNVADLVSLEDQIDQLDQAILVMESHLPRKTDRGDQALP